MTRKLFLRLDSSSLSADDMAAFVNASTVSTIAPAENCYQFDFAPVVLDHALLLLGDNKSRFGFDLWHYLHSAQGFFGQTQDGFVVMPESTPDFKRRFSEDIGVAIGSLFLAETLGLKWETIAQIPTNEKLNKHAQTPDFVGFDQGTQKRVYECKGTTTPNKVDEVRQKAKSQLEDHKEAGVSKYAMVTYIPTSPKLIPPFLFVSDPPIPPSFMTIELATGLHHILAFEFAGQDQLGTRLRRALAQEYAIAKTIANGDEPTRRTQQTLRTRYEELRSEADAAADSEDVFEFLGDDYIGRWRTVEDQQRKVKIFTGISTDQVVNVTRALAAEPDPQEPFVPPRVQGELYLQNTDGDQVCRFADGTLLLIKKPE